MVKMINTEWKMGKTEETSHSRAPLSCDSDKDCWKPKPKHAPSPRPLRNAGNTCSENSFEGKFPGIPGFNYDTQIIKRFFFLSTMSSFWFFLNSEFLMLSRGTIPNRCHWHDRNIISAEEPPPSQGSGNIGHEMNEVPPGSSSGALRCGEGCGWGGRRPAATCATRGRETQEMGSVDAGWPQGRSCPQPRCPTAFPIPWGHPENMRVSCTNDPTVSLPKQFTVKLAGGEGIEIQVTVRKPAQKTLQGDRTAHLRRQTSAGWAVPRAAV